METDNDYDVANDYLDRVKLVHYTEKMGNNLEVPPPDRKKLASSGMVWEIAVPLQMSKDAHDDKKKKKGGGGKKKKSMSLSRKNGWDPG